MTSDDTDAAGLRAREAARCEALSSGDADALEAMLADDLVHIHLNGATDDKAGYLGGVRAKYRFRRIARGALEIRVYGDLAVMTGPLSQAIEVIESGDLIEVEAVTTQVWIRRGGAWLLNTCHNAPIASR